MHDLVVDKLLGSARVSSILTLVEFFDLRTDGDPSDTFAATIISFILLGLRKPRKNVALSLIHISEPTRRS